MTVESILERRSSQRKLFSTTACLTCQDDACVHGRTLDISLTGMAVVMPLSPALGLIYMIVFSVPTAARQSKKIEITGRTIYSILSGPQGGFRVGLEFVDISVDIISAIQAFIRL